jgi:hypothetical protein
VRASCAIAQNPLLRRIGIFVVEMATSMSMIKGTAASRVSRPARTSAPQAISTTPTNGAITSGEGMPILVKRPTPRSPGNRNFWMPSERKTAPTARRIRITTAGALVASSFCRNVIRAPLSSLAGYFRRRGRGEL